MNLVTALILSRLFANVPQGRECSKNNGVMPNACSMQLYVTVVTCQEWCKHLPEMVHKACAGLECHHILLYHWIGLLHPVNPVEDACNVRHHMHDFTLPHVGWRSAQGARVATPTRYCSSPNDAFVMFALAWYQLISKLEEPFDVEEAEVESVLWIAELYAKHVLHLLQCHARLQVCLLTQMCTSHSRMVAWGSQL